MKTNRNNSFAVIVKRNAVKIKNKNICNVYLPNNITYLCKSFYRELKDNTGGLKTSKNDASFWE